MFRRSKKKGKGSEHEQENPEKQRDAGSSPLKNTLRKVKGRGGEKGKNHRCKEAQRRDLEPAEKQTGRRKDDNEKQEENYHLGKKERETARGSGDGTGDSPVDESQFQSPENDNLRYTRIPVRNSTKGNGSRFLKEKKMRRRRGG